MKHLEKILPITALLTLTLGAGLSVTFLSLLPTAAALPLAYLTHRLGEKKARKKGKKDLDKAINSIIETLIEFTGIISTLLLAPVSWPVIAALSAFSLHESIKYKLKAKLNTGDEFLGSQERILLIAAFLGASHFNSYFLVYGLAFVAAVTVFELLVQVWRALR